MTLVGERALKRQAAADYITGETFQLVMTAEGWWATEPAPSDITLYYPQIYYGVGMRRFPWVIEALQEILYRRRASWVTRVAGKAGRALDVGCGPGHLLARFRTLGWEAVGTEASDESAAIPRERYGLDVRAGELHTLRFPDASFDAVVSWHTLEHMRQPWEVLHEFKRLLKPGGLLLLSVPDFSSREAQVKPAAWFHLDVPRHLAHFPAAVLRAKLRSFGFAIEDDSYFAPEYDTFSLVQTWQNRIGLPHNLLYLMLKSVPATPGVKSRISDRALAVLLAAGMLPMALLVGLWRAWRKRGAVVVLLARRDASPA